VIYAFEGGYVDNGVTCSGWSGYGKGLYDGPAIGVAYEVEGTLKW